MMELMGLKGLGHLYPIQLSDLQRQCVALARIFVSEPRMILMDEPFYGIDSHLKWIFEWKLHTVLKQYRGVTLLTSDSRDEIFKISSKIVILSDGSVSASGDKWNLFYNPQHYDACQVMGCKNFSVIERIAGNRLFARDWNMELEVKRTIGSSINCIGVRAHHLELTDDADLSNIAEFDVIGDLHDAFSYILMVKKKKGGGGYPIRLEISKERYDEMECLPRYLRIPPEQIMLLTR